MLCEYVHLLYNRLYYLLCIIKGIPDIAAKVYSLSKENISIAAQKNSASLSNSLTLSKSAMPSYSTNNSEITNKSITSQSARVRPVSSYTCTMYIVYFFECIN